MFVVVDIGNSLTKFHLKGETYYDINSLCNAFETLLLQYNGSSLDFDTFRVFMISSRKVLNADIRDEIKFRFKEIQKSKALWFPLEFNDELIEYKNQIKDIYPELGQDRSMKLLGALKMFPEENVALFDFGTAFTLSLGAHESDAYSFRGGMIDIGFVKSFDLIGKYMDALPSIDFKRLERFYFNFDSVVGTEEFTNTELAILQGVFSRIVGTISEWKNFAANQMATPITTVACGNSAKFFTNYVDHLVEDVNLYEAAFKD